LAEIVGGEREKLEREWANGGSSTEELRATFQRYRVLFDTLLSL
jgi:hypothetical protein